MNYLIFILGLPPIFYGALLMFQVKRLKEDESPWREYLVALDKRTTILLGTLWVTIVLFLLFTPFIAISGPGSGMVLVMPLMVLVLFVAITEFFTVLYKLIVALMYTDLPGRLHLAYPVRYLFVGIVFELMLTVPVPLFIVFIFSYQKMILLFFVLVLLYVGFKMKLYRHRDFYWKLLAYALVLPIFVTSVIFWFFAATGQPYENSLAVYWSFAGLAVISLFFFLYYLLFYSGLARKERNEPKSTQ